MASIVEGTPNVRILEDYLVIPTTSILPQEYPLNRSTGLNETIKLQRCVIGGHKAIIMRPDTHERGMFHGPKHLELIGAVKFRQVLGLEDESAVDVEVEGDDSWLGSRDLNRTQHFTPSDAYRHIHTGKQRFNHALPLIWSQLLTPARSATLGSAAAFASILNLIRTVKRLHNWVRSFTTQ
jgi:hypothetical protein